MKRLVLLGEGHGEVFALPILVRKILKEKSFGNELFVDRDVIRRSPSQLVKWNRDKKKPDFTIWVSTVTLAARRRDIGGVLAVYDGDCKHFPAGSGVDFCSGQAAFSMADAAKSAGAGSIFSLAVVFACAEYETWLVAGAESLRGRFLKDGRLALPGNVSLPSGNPESHGKRWLEDNCQNYRPSRDQGELTELLDLQCIRTKNLRSFQRLEHALEQLLSSVAEGCHISSPA